MKVILTFISLLSCTYIYSQKTIDSIQIENPLLNIGKKISKENNFEPYRYEYRGYQYLPPQKDSILFDGVAFGQVIVTVNKRGKIETLSFRRSYSGVDSNYLIEILNKDFEVVANWISRKYSIDKFWPLLQHGDDRVWNEEAWWVIKKKGIRLIKSFVKERRNNKLLNVLELRIY